MATKKRPATIISWGSGPRDRRVACDMKHVIAWAPAPAGQVDVWLVGGAVARLPITPEDFGMGHAIAGGYSPESPTAQTDLPITKAAT